MSIKACLLIIAIFLLQGCSSSRLSVTPASGLSSQKHGVLCGVLKYEMSNTQYLPQIINQKFESLTPYPSFEYAYEVRYDVDYDSVFELFNPFLVLGIPKSQDDVFISGQLQITGANNFSRLYRQTLSVSKSESVFSDGDTLSEMRKKGLVALRDAIDEMVLADLPLLASQGIACKLNTNS